MSTPDIIKHLNDIKTDLEFSLKVHNPDIQDVSEQASADRETATDIVLKIQAIEQAIDCVLFSQEEYNNWVKSVAG